MKTITIPLTWNSYYFPNIGPIHLKYVKISENCHVEYIFVNNVTFTEHEVCTYNQLPNIEISTEVNLGDTVLVNTTDGPEKAIVTSILIWPTCCIYTCNCNSVPHLGFFNKYSIIPIK